MPCYSPLTAYRSEGGGPLIFGNPRGQCEVGELSLPCGQCIGCRLDRSVDWAVRIMCESQMHEYSSFVTLTYADENVPYGGDLHYRHYQLFMKRLIKKVGPVRFFMCGEYGDMLHRPHYHACLFGVFFADRREWRTSSAGFQLYRSELLESVWPHGHCEIGDLSFESAAYVARYCTKKITGKMADAHYERLVPDTGEIINLTPEFANMSRGGRAKTGGIGDSWLKKYRSDIFPRGAVVMDGREVPLPRFFVEKLTVEQQESLSMAAYLRRMKSWHVSNSKEESPERLRVREIVARAGLMHSQSNRSLD